MYETIQTPFNYGGLTLKTALFLPLQHSVYRMKITLKKYAGSQLAAAL